MKSQAAFPSSRFRQLLFFHGVFICGTGNRDLSLPLANDKAIDASVYQLPDGNWRMWYNNEKDGI